MHKSYCGGTVARIPRAPISRGKLLTRAAAASPARRAELKADLLSLIKPVKRGLIATDEEKRSIDTAASLLERVNPNPETLASSLINGQWRLVYTTSESILGTSKPAAFRPAGPIYQYIDTSCMKALNRETAPFFNQVQAELTATSKTNVAVQFVLFKIFGLLPVKAPGTARGQLDTTYLDEDMRIGRGDKGNLFVLLMEKPGCLL